MSSSVFVFGGLIAIAGIVHLAGLIWLLVHAFKVSSRWGMLLLLPYVLSLLLQVVGMRQIGALVSLAAFCCCIAFVVKNWQQAKRPFLLLLASWGVIVVGFVGIGFALTRSALGEKIAEEVARAQQQAKGGESALPLPKEMRKPKMALKPAQTEASEPELAQAPAATIEPAAASRLEERPIVTEKRAENPASEPNALAWNGQVSPIVMRCEFNPYDSKQSVQYVTLCISNSCPKPVTAAKVRLSYFDVRGEKIKEWTTHRQFDSALASGQATQIDHPAYFMPAATKKTCAEVKSVTFADGSQWQP